MLCANTEDTVAEDLCMKNKLEICFQTLSLLPIAQQTMS